ncbi:unnamed protein product, partial [Ectocarpus sp. 12 AP-2014]
FRATHCCPKAAAHRGSWSEHHLRFKRRASSIFPGTNHKADMYAPTPSSIGGGGRMPPSHQELIHSHSGRHTSGGTATAAVPWDSDNVAYV